MKRIWIIGFGHFGQRALEKLSRTGKNHLFTIVDRDPAKLASVSGPNLTTVDRDGVEFLSTRLFPGIKEPPDMIIPALPVHLAALWCLETFEKGSLVRIPIPKEIDKGLPHPFRGQNGDLYLSHADFMCPDDCPEPSDTCTVTGKKRPGNLFDILSAVRHPEFLSLVIRSRQLAPGVGGYRPSDLFSLLGDMENRKTAFLVSTACRCHGVMTGIGKRAVP